MKLIASSVIRGSHQGESHGGVYLVDLEKEKIKQVLDWDTMDIDWQGRGWDRGLRGIAFDNDVVYIAASDELFAYTPDFKLIGSWKNSFLKHCHEIAVYNRMLFLSSTAYDSILGFDLDKQEFVWALHIQKSGYQFKSVKYDPNGSDGPLALNELHINNVFCNENGIYISGLNTQGMLHFSGNKTHMAVELPNGIHNARPFRNGVLFNDTADNVLRYVGRDSETEDRALAVPNFDQSQLEHVDKQDDKLARVGFARGLCVLSDKIVAGGSSPSTISLYNLAENKRLLSVNLSLDVRNAVHGLEIWPY